MSLYTRQPSLFEEMREIRRFFKMPKEERDIVFFAEHGGYWPSFEGLIKEFTLSGKKICYITADWKDAILATPASNITPVYANKLLPLLMQIIDSRVIVLTLTDLSNHSIKRSRYPVHYVYVFHALVSTHMMYNFGAFDHYDSVLCVGPHQVEELQKQEELYHLRRKQLVKAGYYRLERIIDAYTQYRKETEQERKTILIAPSWGDENVLERCGGEIIRILLHAGYRVIVRPHSETIKRSPGLIREIEKEFSENHDFVLETSNASDHAMIAADVLISDCSGITLEYAFGTERPVIFIDVPLKIKNARYQELGILPLEVSLRSKIGRIVSLTQRASLPRVIEDMIVHREDYKKNITEARKEYVFNIGTSSKIGAEYLLNL